MIGSVVFLIALFALMVTSITLQICGIVVSFQKKWYLGFAAIVCPPFAFAVGIAKVFKKDILK